MADLKKRGRPAAKPQDNPSQNNQSTAQGRGRPELNAHKPADVERAELEQQGRKKERVSMARTRKLDYTPPAGYSAYYFKDLPGRIDQALAAGYEFATDSQGKKITRQSGPNILYCMIIPKELRQEDFEAGQAKVNDVTRSALKDAMTVNQGGPAPDYVPDGLTNTLERDLPI